MTLHASIAGGAVYLPVIHDRKQEQSPPSATLSLFGTHISARTPAQWQDLARVGVQILERGYDWAVVLADDVQLADLARLRFNSDGTQALGTLAAAYGPPYSCTEPFSTTRACLFAWVAAVLSKFSQC